MRKTADEKKLVSFSEDSREVREKIKGISLNSGLSESRIIENCLLYGYCFLYGEKNEVEKIDKIMKKRYGNINTLNNMKCQECHGILKEEYR
ncbi:hypothetical protein [uncultured Clostridium sp.]|uniref:hypothetical protein n=1 Tax=uncultured Clostridium sp. TaxID=59620 RepID=UPI0027DB9F9D|nr:hypothetical protein [uncultured Clostridium sp.]